MYELYNIKKHKNEDREIFKDSIISIIAFAVE